MPAFIDRCCGILDKLGIWHWVLVIFLIAYTVLGGLCFMACEHKVDKEKKHEQWVNATRTYNSTLAEIAETKRVLVVSLIEFANRPRLDEASLRRSAENELDLIIRELKVKVPKEPEEEESQWTFIGSMFYACTIYTTIGYGKYCPETFEGQLATIFYGLIGIPLVLIVLSDIGKVMFRCMKFICGWIYRLYDKTVVVCCKRYNKKYTVDQKRRKQSEMWTKFDDKEEDTTQVPLTIAIIILVLWICACAGIFKLLREDGDHQPTEKEWTYFECVYFFFISLTTIGLGDFVPKKGHRLFSFPLLILGQSVITVCIMIMQAKMEVLFQEIMGLIDKDYQNAQTGDEPSVMTPAAEGAPPSGGVAKLGTKLPFGKRMLFGMMGSAKKKQLEKKFDARAKQLTVATQTEIIQNAPIIIRLHNPKAKTPTTDV